MGEDSLGLVGGRTVPFTDSNKLGSVEGGIMGLMSLRISSTGGEAFLTGLGFGGLGFGGFVLGIVAGRYSCDSSVLKRSSTKGFVSGKEVFIEI